MAFDEPAKLKRDEEFVVTMGVPQGVIEGSSSLAVLKTLLAEKKAAAAAKAVKPQAKALPVRAGAKGKLSPAAKAKLVAEQRKAVQAAEKVAKSDIVSVPVMPQKMEEYKVKATVAWSADGGRKIGLEFSKIPEAQRRQIEGFLRGLCA